MRAANQRAATTSPPRCQCRRPEHTPLYRLVQQHAHTFIVQVEPAGAALPSFVTDEFAAYLDCGILAHGLIRLTCDSCKLDTLVAFSCKRCAICPACGTRRMNEAAAGAVTLIQRFGSEANLNIHLHGLWLDAVYERTSDGEPIFHEPPRRPRQRNSKQCWVM